MADELKLDKRGRGYVRVGAGVTAVLTGEDDVLAWDDEELAFGRRRGPSGKFGGQPPRVIPTACLRELVRRKIFDTESAIRDSCVDAAQYLAAVANGREEPNPARMKACEMVLDRFLGKPVDRIQMSSQVDMNMTIVDAPWAVALRNAVRSGGITTGTIPASSTEVDDIVDAELVEDDLCACGCGQPPRPGSLYLNSNHEAHARSKTAQPRPTPTEEDLNLWRRNNGPTPPPVDPDLILEDDDDEFIEEDDDDPVIW